jgi:glutaredoxin 3
MSMQVVKIYTTGSCPYCIQAKALLKQRGVVELDEVRVDMLQGEREKMMEITGRRTVPQIFIGSTHVGGCDDLVALDSRGGLLPMLSAA